MRYLLLIACLLFSVTAFAEDGEMFVRNVSKTPDLETNHATLRVLYTNVPARDSRGEATTIEYPFKDSETDTITSKYAKPLVAFYHDGPVVNPEDSGEFPGHGNRDVFGAVSLDDGTTWQRTNLSDSGYKSSFTLKDHTPYYGDTFRLFANSAGNKVLVAWASRYANGGNPNYAMADKTALADYLGITVDHLYLNDIWGVSGSQGSSDFADEGYPSVGEVPFAALWTARGTLETVLDANGDAVLDAKNKEVKEIVWRQAERLTSARRDVHRIEVGAAGDAGFVVTWQEDPDGLRPGEGEGPGEGWSGAVAHHQTDIWYSYIDWDNFDLVDDSADGWNPIPVADYDFADSGTPEAAIPFSMPVRLTDNTMCVPIGDDPYVYADLDGDGEVNDLCASSKWVTEYDTDGTTVIKTTLMCVAEDGRLMRGNTAATRARVNLRGYDSNNDGTNDSAWVVLAYEESKGLGEEIDLDPQELIEKTDMGKNIWYHSFDMRNPELVSQGLMLNMPAVYPEGTPFNYDPGTSRLEEYPVTVDGTYNYRFMRINPDPIYSDQAEMESTLLQTEIARRFSLISQPAAAAGDSGTVAFATWKQGIIRQGGPADVYARRFVIPDVFDPQVDNPFDYSCMDCGTWLFEDGMNPRYVKGLCVSPPQAMSATSLIETSATGFATSSIANGTVDQLVEAFPWNEAFDDIDMSALEDVNLDKMPKIYEWSQSGPDYGVDPATLLTVDPNTHLTPDTNFDDQSWENPYDVAKGHRGYISGDFIMLLYAWSPNWLANTWGHDNYNLYVRRSFDGGATWTTTPADFVDTQGMPEGLEYAAAGTEFYEWMGPAGTTSEYKVIYTLGEGVFEPARSMSLLNGLKETVLDPRYAPTGGATHSSILTDGEIMFPDDERDPSKFFITFEVGDNTTSAEGEAMPMDMYYSRAYNYGDDYEVIVDEEAEATENDYYFDWLEGKKDDHAAEASLSASPGGGFFWAIWEQWKEDEHENVSDSDAIMRRLMFDADPVDGDDGNDKPVSPGPGKKK